MMKRILVVDDDVFFRKMITKLLSGQGYDITAAESGEEALQTLQARVFDLMISDINMAPVNGMELLEKVQTSCEDMSVIMLTGRGEIEVALEAMKKGAFDFLAKPFQIPDLFSAVRRSFEETENIQALPAEELPGGLVAQSTGMRKVCDMIRRIAPADVTVLLCGESGTDKESVARALHGLSPRKDAPFVVFDCSAHPNDMNVKLLSRAPGGTLVFTNVETLPSDRKKELFNMIQSNKSNGGHAPVTARLIVAPGGRQETLNGERMFCETLYSQLSALRIDLPPLRSCPCDIPLLVVRTLRQKLGPDAALPVLAADAKEILYNHIWPGNTRELETAVLHALALAQDGVISKAMLPEETVAAYEEGIRSQTIVKPGSQLRGQAFKAFLHKKQEELLSRFHSAESSADSDSKPENPAENKKNWKWI